MKLGTTQLGDLLKQLFVHVEAWVEPAESIEADNVTMPLFQFFCVWHEWLINIDPFDVYRISRKGCNHSLNLGCRSNDLAYVQDMSTKTRKSNIILQLCLYATFDNVNTMPSVAYIVPLPNTYLLNYSSSAALSLRDFPTVIS